jgi:Ser/Thr protein kinase RdoA (MazF antagonist)
MPNPQHDSAAARSEDPSRVRLQVTADLRAAIEEHFGFRLAGDPVGVTGGDECAIWRVGAVAVRIAPTWRGDDEIAWVHDLVRHVATIVPEAIAPAAAADGTTFLRYDGYPVSILPYIEGDVLDRTPAHVTAAGGMLARVHRAIATWKPRTSRPAIVERRARVPLPGDLDDIDLARWHETLATTGEPRAVVHGDFYRRNVLVRDGRIVALLDWDEAHEDYLAQEIAWSMWEFAKRDGVRMDEALATAFVDGYVGAGGRLPPAFRTNAVSFIRWRLRDELHLQFTARASGDPVDDTYFETELTAFRTLRDSTRDSNTF